jgi:hypothetical protein
MIAQDERPEEAPTDDPPRTRDDAAGDDARNDGAADNPRTDTDSRADDDGARAPVVESATVVASATGRAHADDESSADGGAIENDESSAGGDAEAAKHARVACPPFVPSDSSRARPEVEPGASVHVSQLLVAHDRRFVEGLYAAALGRAPAPDESADALAELRSGRLTKEEIVARVVFSDEGARAGAASRVAGVRRRAGWSRRAARLPVVGYLWRLLRGLARLPVLMEHQRQFELYAHAEQQDLAARFDAEHRRLVDHVNVHLGAAVSDAAVAVSILSDALAELSNRQADWQQHSERLHAQLSRALADHQRALEEHQRGLGSLGQSLAAHSARLDSLDSRADASDGRADALDARQRESAAAQQEFLIREQQAIVAAQRAALSEIESRLSELESERAHAHAELSRQLDALRGALDSARAGAGGD